MQGIIYNLIIAFFIFSFMGWCIEIILKFRQYHKFVNRGFFIGPYLPIYGAGAIAITLILDLISGFEASVGTTFVMSVVICGIIEYLSSYILEKKYHARWWDYSSKPMNLHGRIWIGNLLLFGLGGILIYNIINPLLFDFLDRTDIRIRGAISIILLCIFAADYAFSHVIMKLVKSKIESSEADSTEQIGEEIRMMLHQRNILYRRFADAYPEVIYRTDRIKARLEEIKAETERIRQKLREEALRLEERKPHL